MKEIEDITLNTLYKKIATKEEISNCHIKKEMTFNEIKITDEVHTKVSFINCEIESIKSIFTVFLKPIIFRGCTLHYANFWSNSFCEGLLIEDCEFYSNVTFETGGHNKIDKSISIINSRFHGAVDFFDCWYKGPVEISNCEFVKGTNLLGNMDRIGGVDFDIKPIIDSNKGRLDLDQDELQVLWIEKIGLLPSKFYEVFKDTFPDKFISLSYNKGIHLVVHSTKLKDVFLKMEVGEKNVNISINNHLSQRFELKPKNSKYEISEIRKVITDAIEYMRQVFNDEIVIEKSLSPFKQDVLNTYHKDDSKEYKHIKHRKYTWNGPYKNK